MESEKKSHLDALLEALESNSLQDVRSTVNNLRPGEIALLLESLPLRERAIVWDLIEGEKEGDILVELNDPEHPMLEQLPRPVIAMKTEDLLRAALRHQHIDVSRYLNQVKC